MDKKRRVVRVVAVLGVALAAGHYAQTYLTANRSQPTTVVPKNIETVSSGETRAGQPFDPSALPAGASLAAAPEAAAPAGDSVEGSLAEAAAPAEPRAEAVEMAQEEAVTLPDPAAMLTAETEAPAPLAEAEVEVQPEAPASGLAEGAAPEGTEPEVALASCDPVLALSAVSQAMIAVSVKAECSPGSRVVLRHAGLVIAERLDATGRLEIDLPALQVEGVISALFEDASVLTDTVMVPDAAQTRRFGVQWIADDSFQVAVSENGAGYGAPGDVRAESPVSPNGGYLVSLGDPGLDLPMMAQIYTWPQDAAVSVAPMIEAAVTDATCAREILGETLVSREGRVTVEDLSLAIPDCTALGDILVLNNPLGETTLASVN